MSMIDLFTWICQKCLREYPGDGTGLVDAKNDAGQDIYQCPCGGHVELTAKELQS